MADVQITVLAENTVYQRGLRGEHGLSFWIETNDKKILFDTGQSDLLLGQIKNGKESYTAVRTSVFPGVTITGQVPRVSGFEDTGGALFLESTKGLIVVFGCPHAGVVNTLEHLRQMEPDKRVHAVLGDMHLDKAGQTRIEKTIEAFRRFGIERLGPAHCTGWQATRQLWNAFGNRYFQHAICYRSRINVASTGRHISCRHMNTNVALVGIPLNVSTA